MEGPGKHFRVVLESPSFPLMLFSRLLRAAEDEAPVPGVAAQGARGPSRLGKLPSLVPTPASLPLLLSAKAFGVLLGQADALAPRFHRS